MANPVSISIAGLTVLTWVMTAAALLMTAGRFAIRYKSSQSFYASDYINGLACVFLVAFAATYTSHFELYYAVEFYAAEIGPAVSDNDLVVYFKTEAAVSMLFWVIIYLVKASFLMLYHTLFKVSARFMQIWWVVTIFTAVCFLMSFIGVLWECGYNPAHDLFKPEYCLTQDAITASVNVVKFWCAINVFSDFLIILLPVYMLRSLQMSLMTKIGLALIFAVALIDVAFDIVRTVYTLDGGAVAIDTIWDILEPPIAVMVCSMPTYRHVRAIYKKHHHKDGKSIYKTLQASSQRTDDSSRLRTEKKPSSSTQSSHLPLSLVDVDDILVERTYDVRIENASNTV